MNNRQAIRFAILLPAILALFLVAGCGGEATEENSETTSTETQEVAAALTEAQEAMVAQAAAIAVAVEKAPAMAEAILKEKGVSPDEYEAMIYKIAGDPKLSAAFEKAKASL